MIAFAGTDARPKKPRRHPRWMITFADLMALLFALFVLLLSFSEINSDSFRKNAGPINMAFNATPVLQPDRVRPSAYAPIVPAPTPIVEEEARQDPAREVHWKAGFIEKLNDSLAAEISGEMLDIVEQENTIVIRFPDRTAFATGTAKVSTRFESIIDKIALVLNSVEGKIKVSGHTDDVPIIGGIYRSNWELSTSRSVSVVHRLLAGGGIDPRRVTAQGFADSQPLAANDTPENRARNRRVEISVEIGRGAK